MEKQRSNFEHLGDYSERSLQLFRQVFQLISRPGYENHILSAGCQRMSKTPFQPLRGASDETKLGFFMSGHSV